MFEVFFDLVFVFALTRVIDLMEEDPGVESLAHGLLILVLLWWVWTAFIWLGNRVRLDCGHYLVGMLVVMTAIFVAALVIPVGWDPREDAPNPAIILALAFTVVRCSYLVMFIRASREDDRLRTQILIDSVIQVLSTALLLVGAALGGSIQTILWASAFLIDFGIGRLVSRYNGWRVGRPGHFVERHALVLLIALGETLLSAGTKISAATSNALTLSAAVLAFLLVVGLWWCYFGGLSDAAERVLSQATPSQRPALARDAYTLSNFPLICGVVFAALGISLIVDEIAVEPLRPAQPVAVVALAGGVAVYLVGIQLFRRSALGTWARSPILGALASFIAGAATTAIPAAATLGLVTAIALVTAAFNNRSITASKVQLLSHTATTTDNALAPHQD
ncbi:low temperature requirement protein A [Leifsonia flava]|nr:low temperature requirement protein A [Leifsonia flava]